MKRLILLTTLAAAIVPATASAWPGTPREPYPQDDYTDRPGWHSDRDANPESRFDWRTDRGFRDHWITLSAFTPARKGMETVYLTDRRERRIDTVKLTAVRGAPVVKSVIIQYRNGQYERRPVNQQLTPGRDAVISLESGRPIQKVMISTEPRSGGAYSVLGAG